LKLRSLLSLILSGQLPLTMKVLKTTEEFYRACFVSTALSEGIYEKLKQGPVTIEQLCGEADSGTGREGLRAWLDLGVSLGELGRGANGYRIKGSLSRRLATCGDDTYQALLQEIVEHHYRYILRTPSMVRQRERFPFDEAPGKLIARSSRVVEPLIFEAVDEAVPRHGPFRLLEVGCGTGVHIRRACARNPSLTAVGLELQGEVADLARENMRSWGLDGRVKIENCDVREYAAGPEFDLATLHQNIYYFRVEERVSLARHLGGFLKPGGRLLITTACQGGSPAVQALNIWVSTTEGYGPLPAPEQLCAQLRDAGYSEVRAKKLIPLESFYSFSAHKPARA
jgi:4-hydroxy-2,2'-bipyrrole-5-carbaldehyde O-methyltransferase